MKAKTKESVVELINSSDFFDLLKNGIVSSEYLETIDDTKKLVEEGDAYQTVEEDLKDFLSLDSNYKDLFLIKKLTRFIDELTNRKDLREKAFKFLPPNYEYEEGEASNSVENMQRIKSLGLNLMLEKERSRVSNTLGGGERLNTIEEEEKQFETQSNINKKYEGRSNKSGSVYKKSKNKGGNTNSQGFLSESVGFNQNDSRKRLDDVNSDIDERRKNGVRSNNEVGENSSFE